MIKIIQRDIQFANGSKDISVVSKGSHKKTLVECPMCEVQFKREIRTIYKHQHTYCPSCNSVVKSNRRNSGRIIGDFKFVSGDGKMIVIECIECQNRKQVTMGGFRKGIYHSQCGKDLEMAGTQFYSIWANMKTRTNNPNYEKWERYGGRGIKSDDFDNFADFYRDMYSSYIKHVEIYGEENTTIDRIDNDKDYTKRNCRWATWDQQANNRSNHIQFEAISTCGKVYTGENLKRFCEKHKLDYGVIGTQLSTIECYTPYTNRKSGWVFTRKSATTIEK